jgi:hypothetical protein
MHMGGADGPTEWLNLDAGTVVEKPNGWWLAQAANVNERNTLPGVGFSTNVVGFNATAIGRTFLLAVPDENWSSGTPQFVGKKVNQLASELLVKSGSPLTDSTVMAGDGLLPKTYIFRTPSRTIGLLQATGFTEQHDLKVRYKLVQDRPAPVSHL